MKFLCFQLTDNAIFNKGDRLARRATSSFGKSSSTDVLSRFEGLTQEFEATSPAERTAENPKKGHIIVAQTMSRVASAMQKEILEGKLIN